MTELTKQTMKATALIMAAVVISWLFIIHIVLAQQPPMTFPDHDVSYNCVPTVGAGAPVTFKFTAVPSPHFDVTMGNDPVSPDHQHPVLVSITNTAGVDVTTGNVRLLAGNNGLPITITAADSVGVVGGRLDVDGKLGTPFGNGSDVLPSTFYVRWNARTIAPGLHNFKLTVWDAAQNKAEKTWTMTK